MILQALVIADLVLITIGSAKAARRFDYVPFTAAEREQMIRLMLTPEQNARVRFVHVEDQGNMQRWSGIVRLAANEIEPNNDRITLIGHAKDNSSYYLKGFKGWEGTKVDNYMGLSATTYRDALFTSNFNPTSLRTDALHPEVQEWLIDFTKTDPYQHLVEEAAKCAEDLQKYGHVDHKGVLRYGPVLAADFVCIQGDHVLAVERNTHPFKGHYVLPGGIVDPDEDVIEAAIREGQREETGLKVPEQVLRKAYVATETFSAPYRDPRGRVVSFASLFHLNPVPPANMTDPKEIEKYLALPRVRRGPDPENEVRRALWMPIVEFTREKTGFDHFVILQRMLEYLPKDQ